MEMRSLTRVALGGLLVGALLCVAPTSVGAPSEGAIQIVQAVPDASVDVTLDGKKVGTAVEVGKILGPFSVVTGEHTVRFAGPNGAPVTATVTVKGGSSTDVVIHRPASV